MHRSKAEITEVFSSIQGEGVFLGARQIFVRFKECNLKCSYCDENKGLKSKAYSVTDLMGEVKFLELSRGPHHSVSFTGGEPLLYTDFLEVFLELLKKESLKTYLETNGTLPNELARVVDRFDIIAMDFKLPSSTGERPFWKEHREFLKIASKKKVFVKAVVTQSTIKDDIERSIRLIRKVRPDIPFIIQPAAPVHANDKTVAKDKLIRFLDIGVRRNLENIRVIPQIHKILDIK